MSILLFLFGEYSFVFIWRVFFCVVAVLFDVVCGIVLCCLRYCFVLFAVLFFVVCDVFLVLFVVLFSDFWCCLRCFLMLFCVVVLFVVSFGVVWCLELVVFLFSLFFCHFNCITTQHLDLAAFPFLNYHLQHSSTLPSLSTSSPLSAPTADQQGPSSWM